MNDKKQIKVFVLVKVLEHISLSWISASYVLFLASFGLNYLQINSINMFFMGGNVLFDAVSGVAGDVLGQTRVYNFGSLIMLISMLAYANASSYWWFVLAEVLGAVGHSAWSEALESWLQNSLSDENKTIEVKQAQIRAQQIALVLEIGIVLLAGVAVTHFGLGVIWTLSGVNTAVTLLVGMVVLKEFPKAGPKVKQPSFLNTLVTAIAEVKANKHVRQALFVAFVTAACFQPLNMFWTLVFKDYVPVGFLNVVWVGINIITIFGNFLASKLHWEKDIKTTLIPLFYIAITLGIGVLSQNWLVLLCMFLAHEVGRTMLPRYLWSYCSNNMDNDEVRTTVNSLRSTAQNIGAFAGLFVSGWLAVQIGPIAVWGVCALILLVVCVWFFVQKD